MGGKSSKGSDTSKEQAQASKNNQGSFAAGGSNANSIVLTESSQKPQTNKNSKDNQTKQTPTATITKASQPLTIKLQTISQQDQQKSYLEIVLSMIVHSERLVQLMEAEEEVALPLSKMQKDLKNTALLRHVHSTVKSSFSKSELNELVKLFHDICNEHPGYYKVDLFLTCLMTGLRSVKIPAAGEPSLDLVTAISQIFEQEASEYEGTGWEQSVRVLVKDLSVLAGHPLLDNQDFTTSYKAVQEKLAEIPKEKFRVEHFEATLLAVQKWVYEESEEIEGNEQWKSIVSLFRKQAAKSLNGKYFDLKYSGPNSLVLPNSVLYNSYHFSYNCNFGVVNFADMFMLARTINDFLINYYIEDERVVSKVIRLNCDIQMRGFKVNERKHQKYLPTFGSLVKMLNSYHTEIDVDIVNDFDLIAILNQDGKYRFAYKNDLINPLVKQGNITDIKLFFSNQESFRDKATLKIILKSADSPQGETYGSYFNLLLANHEDTLQVLHNKLKKLNFDVENKELPEDLLKHLLSTLVVTTKSSLSQSEHKAALEKAKSKKYSFNTKLADLLAEVGHELPTLPENGQTVDLVFYLDYTGFEFYQSKMSPPTVDQNYDGEEKISFSFELSDIFNIALDVMGYDQEYARNLTEANILELLPGHIFVNLESINKFINVPKEVEIDMLKGVISEQSLSITNQYKAISYLAKTKLGDYYQIRTVPNEIDMAAADYNFKEYREQLRDLNMQNIVGVLLERREPNL